MTQELALTGVAGLGTLDEAAVLVSLLSITSDAVLVFDENGVVLLANEEAQRLFRSSGNTLIDTDVRALFPPMGTVAHGGTVNADALPFALDGSSTTLILEGAEYAHVRVGVRCERLATSRVAYLLCAHVVASEGDYKNENERLVEELSRANKRLSGTLGIVLGTLDSLDVGTLFERILDEITAAMDAWTSMIYMAEHDGYRLRGATASLGDAPVPAYLPYDHPLAELAGRQGHCVRFRVKALTRDELRGGAVTTRDLVEDESGVTVTVPAALVPPCTSFAVVPVWFGGHMIALIVVGWRHAYRLPKEDARLLDAVAEYLSVQLAGALAALRAQHAEHLESLSSTLREHLLSSAKIDADLVDGVFADAAQGIDATCVPLEGNHYQRTTMGDFASIGRHSVPFDLAATLRTHEAPFVCSIAEVEGLATWLSEMGEPSQGLLVALGGIDDVEKGYLMLREHEEAPFEEVDESFLHTLVQDVCEASAGEQARKQDKRIAQALQRGMRNELQHVDGISSQSRYSSATEAAYVGGDFYDLVRLPHRRACVIMGDVSGKGVEAASVSAAVKTALGAYAWEGLSPARMVSLLNDFLLGFSRIETFATLFLGIIDLDSATLAYCSAGHPPAFMVRAESGEITMLGVQSGVVGAFEGLRYRDGEVQICPGDILLLYTDGVTEARDPQGAFFGEDGLRDILSQEVASGYDGLCDRILADVSEFAGGSMDDDVALVILRFDDVSIMPET